MGFESGHAKVGGRKKGTKNKAPALMRKAIFAALEAGDGAQAYFEWLKFEKPDVYGSLLKAYIPRDVKVEGGLTVSAVIERSFVKRDA